MYLKGMYFYSYRLILRNGHRQEQTSHKRWQKGRQKESVCYLYELFFCLIDEFIISSFISADPFSKKDWYDIKAPANFEVRNIGRTLVTRTTGTSKELFCFEYFFFV